MSICKSDFNLKSGFTKHCYSSKGHLKVRRHFLQCGGVSFETFNFCRSSTFVKNLDKFDGHHLKSSTLGMCL
jgi:hypothetical protein